MSQLVGDVDRTEDVCLFDGPQLSRFLVRIVPEQEAGNVIARIGQLLLCLSKQTLGLVPLGRGPTPHGAGHLLVALDKVGLILLGKLREERLRLVEVLANALGRHMRADTGK